MGAVTIGPLVFSSERFAAIIGGCAFMLVAWILARKVDERFGSWSSWSILSFILAARAGHVIANVNSFGAEPWRALAFWQGGFLWPAGLFAVIAMSFIYLRNVRLRIWSALPIATGMGVAALVLHQVAELRVIPLPTSSFTSIDGRDVLPGSFLGKPLVINLWATWCPSCRRELPMMAEVAHGSTAATFVFINQREDKETIREFLKQEGITLDTILLDPDGEFRRHYMARGLPTTLFIGSDGELRSLNLGEISRENLIAGVEGIK